MKNNFEVRGDVTAIFLKRKDGLELEAIIDTNDLEKVKSFPNTWFASLNQNSFYVRGAISDEKGKGRRLYLHRYLFDEPNGMDIDHINHNTLDNKRSNLRALTHGQNIQNRKGAQTNCKSGVRGVHWCKYRNKWKALITFKGKQIYIGLFENLIDAEKAVVESRKKYFPYSIEVKK